MEIHACGYDHDHWQGRIARIFSKESLARLESGLGKHNIGIVTIQIDDFFPLAGIYGEDASFQLLEILRDEASVSFSAVFGDRMVICIDDAKINEITIYFRLPENHVAGLASEALALQINLRDNLNRRALDVFGRQLEVLVGYSWIGEDQGAGFHKALFKAYCDARRVAANRTDPTRLVFHKEVIAEPSCPKPSLCLLTPATRLSDTTSSNDWKCSAPVGALVQPAAHVTSDTTVAEVRRMLADTPPMSNVVVVDNRKPVGLLMSYNLDRHLGTTYGISLYFHREVARLMDRSPLIVDAGMPVEKVAKAAMMRDAPKVYDDIIVIEDGVFTGTISVQKMLDTLAKVQVEMAKGANPLTGLPGNVAIEQEISRRAAGGFPASLIYVDLDNFKAYNDAYGFENGDKMISFTSAALSEAVRQEGMPDDFIGHVGGDDFVVISEQHTAEAISRAIVGIFEKNIPELYSETDRKRGQIRGRGRDGAESQYPLVSVSIGIVDCDFERSFSMNELSLRVAEIKKYAKMIPGNAYVRDRRAPLGSSAVDEAGSKEIAECELRIA